MVHPTPQPCNQLCTRLGRAAATPSMLSPPINPIQPKHPPYGSIDVPQSAHSSPGQQRVYNSRHGRGSGGWWIWNPVEPWNPVLQTCSYSLSGRGFVKQGSRVPKFHLSAAVATNHTHTTRSSSGTTMHHAISDVRRTDAAASRADNQTSTDWPFTTYGIDNIPHVAPAARKHPLP